MSAHPEIPDARFKGLGLLAEALTYPDTGETIEIIATDDGMRWFWMHQVATAAGLPNLKSTYRRTLAEGEWQTLDISAGQDRSTNSRLDAMSTQFAPRVILSLPGVIKVLAVSRNNPQAQAFDHWARHEVLAPLLLGRQAPEAPATDHLLAELTHATAKIVDVLDRLTATPHQTRSLPLPPRTTESSRILDKWRSKHVLHPDVWAVAAYVLPVMLANGELRTPPRQIAEQTGLDPIVVNRALLDLLIAGCLMPSDGTTATGHMVYALASL
jgi:prophage antirepressor-like protein